MVCICGGGVGKETATESDQVGWAKCAVHIAAAVPRQGREEGEAAFLRLIWFKAMAGPLSTSLGTCGGTCGRWQAVKSSAYRMSRLLTRRLAAEVAAAQWLRWHTLDNPDSFN